MRKAALSLLAVTAILLIMPRSAGAHHGWAQFDTKAVITLKGIVTDFHYVNPHSVVEFDVKDDKGQVHSWQGEMTSPSHLSPLGWTPATLEPGDQITITGYQAKNGAASLWVTRIVLADGRELKIDGGN